MNNSAESPLVTFVIPCYKLAHLLPECVNSILGQTFTNFEVLIMDDNSPDNTAEVAKSFQDPRVRHIRNEPNLGALANYNKGFSLSRGKYIWLISADDYLRRPYVLQRYVELMESNPRINFTFCAGVGVREGKETGLLGWSAYADRDQVIDGRVLLQRLLDYNLVLAPSALARRDCYEKLSNFPVKPVWSGIQVDLIWGGDWYLWCLFALHGEVGFFAEPMVCYREHELAMTTIVTKDALDNCFRAEIGVTWMIQRRAKALGYDDVVRKAMQALAFDYAHHLTSKPYRSSFSTISEAQFEESLCANTPSEDERSWIRQLTFANAADRCFVKRDYAMAKAYYGKALALNAGDHKSRLKRIGLMVGWPGIALRRRLNGLD
jgi:glycosyltransferase involved in cell wall biosynthesis